MESEEGIRGDGTGIATSVEVSLCIHITYMLYVNVSNVLYISLYVCMCTLWSMYIYIRIINEHFSDFFTFHTIENDLISLRTLVMMVMMVKGRKGRVGR